MAYDPSQTPVRELILSDLETTIAAVAPTSYASTMKFVRRWNGNVLLNVPDYPCALIVPLAETTTEEIGPLMTHFMEVGLVLGVRAQNWPALINKLLADVRVALTQDPSRGGVAVQTKITQEDVAETDPRQLQGSAQMILLIHYRTLYADPNTAK